MQKYTINHEGHALVYVTAGAPENPPIIMIHGYTSSHQVWRTTIPHLQEQFYCVGVDLLGHGDSAIDPAADYSIPAQARRVLAAADALELDRFYLIGHSMGGQIALYITAVLAPQRVIRTISVSGVVTGKLTPAVERGVFRPLRLLYGTPLGRPAEAYQRLFSTRFRWAARRQFATWFYDFDALDFDWWLVDRKAANQPGMRHTWYYGMKAIEDTDLTSQLSSIPVPTLALFGAQDNVVPVSEGQLVRDCVPEGELVLIEACGHFPMYERQAAYIAAVRAFLLADA
ncbi:MAG: alpha/beta fold hydrolase [Chloroflexota bacterium]